MISPLSGAPVPCVGCGGLVPPGDGPVHRYMTASPGCWAAYGELSAHLLQDPRAAAYRQLCVDAYAVQHPGTPNPQAIQSVAVHLMSLYAQIELGLPGAAAPALIQRAVRSKGQYRWLTPPSFEGFLTVGQVLSRRNDLATASRDWAAGAWRAWHLHRDQIRDWYQRVTRR